MANEGDDQPPEHEQQAQPPDDEPQVQQPADEPKVEAGEPEPKTPKPRWWRVWRRRGAQRSGSESRFSVLTAVISAVAALLGATVGGIASYKAAQSQAAAQFRVAQADNAAQADQALISRRQTAYSDYLAAETDLDNAEYRLHDAVVDFKPPDVDPVKAASKQFGDEAGKWVGIHASVRLVDSPEVDQLAEVIANKQGQIFTMAQRITDEALYQMTVDQPALSQLIVEVRGMDDLKTKFVITARADISGSPGR